MKPTSTNTLPTDLVGKLIEIDSNSFFLWKITERLPTLALTYENSPSRSERSLAGELVRSVSMVVGMVVSVETDPSRFSSGGFFLEVLSPDDGLFVVLLLYGDIHAIKLLTQTKKST